MQKVTFQGVKGAYSHIASMELFPQAEYLASETFEQAMELVDRGEADYAIIPVENSNAGRVTDVHFLLPQTDLTIIGEHFLRVEHQLLGIAGTTLAEIEAASSHPQALAQCSNFLKAHQIKAISRIDTAKSCERIAELQDRHRAAIASSLAGKIYGLEVIASNIENDSNNTTRFLVMGKEKSIPRDDGSKFITSLVFRVKNIPAALYKSLGGFATNGVNITKLESYVIGGNFISAQFYIEIEAHPETSAFKRAYEELKFYSESIHFLGTYKADPRRYL